MLKRLRERVGSESGFTLIELLVVMLILGILAAIAIPAFLNQKGKASDTSMKTEARTMQTAMETCSTENPTGTYTGCTRPRLNQIEGTIPAAGPAVTLQNNAQGQATGYTVRSTTNTATGNWFQIVKDPNTGVITRSCPAGNQGGCRSATW